VFIFLFVALKSNTDVVTVAEGWSQQNVDVQNCGFEVPPEGKNKTCNYPYSKWTTKVTPWTQLGANFDGRWSGHPFAKLFLATENEGGQKIIDMFKLWVQNVGTIEGGTSNFFNTSTFVVGNGTNSELTSYLKSKEYGAPFSSNSPECVAAIVFNKMDFENAQFEYSIRLNTTSENPTFRAPRSDLRPTSGVQQAILWSSSSPNPRYIQKSFMTLQQLVDSFIIDVADGKMYKGFSSLTYANISNSEMFQPFGATFIPFPTRGYQWDEFFDYVTEVFSLAFILMYLYPVAKVLSVLVREKESRMNEMLKMMGVAEEFIILSWYVTYAFFFLGLALLVAIGGTVILPNSSFGMIFLLFFLFGIGSMAFCFAASTCFWKSKTAFLVGDIMYFMGYFLYYFVRSESIDPKPFLPLLFPQVAFALSIQITARLESAGAGASFESANEPIDGFTLSYGIFMLVVDFILWTLVGWYLSKVIPQEFGTSRPFYFMFMRTNSENQGQVDTDSSLPSLPSYEKVESSLQVGISIRNLRKTFDTPGGVKVAVKGMNLGKFQSEIENGKN